MNQRRSMKSGAPWKFRRAIDAFFEWAKFWGGIWLVTLLIALVVVYFVDPLPDWAQSAAANTRRSWIIFGTSFAGPLGVMLGCFLGALWRVHHPRPDRGLDLMPADLLRSALAARDAGTCMTLVLPHGALDTYSMFPRGDWIGKIPEGQDLYLYDPRAMLAWLKQTGACDPRVTAIDKAHP